MAFTASTNVPYSTGKSTKEKEILLESRAPRHTNRLARPGNEKALHCNDLTRLVCHGLNEQNFAT